MINNTHCWRGNAVYVTGQYPRAPPALHCSMAFVPEPNISLDLFATPRVGGYYIANGIW